MKNHLVFCLMLFIGDLICGESKKEKWIDAQNICRSEGKKLTTDLRDTDSGAVHWTGNYKKLSRWLHLLGCFAALDVINQGVERNISMPFPSVGMCDEICSLNYPFFGVKNSTCLCLQAFASRNESSPMLCKTTCIVSSDQPFSSECGGNNHYNVFSSVREKFEEVSSTSGCLSMQCGNQSKFYKGDDCNEDYYRTCKSRGTLNKI